MTAGTVRAACPRARPGPRERACRGQSIVELAFVLPLLLILALGIIEFGIMLSDQIAVGNAARDGALVGAVAGLTAAQADADAVAEAGAAATSLISCTPRTPTATYVVGTPGTIRVTASCQYHALTPLGPLLATLFGAAPNTSPILSQTITWQLEQ